MPLCQIQACLSGVDRRDATLALIAMQGAHAAHAPLAVGKDGTSVFERFYGAMKRAMSPRGAETEKATDVRADAKMFEFLKARAAADALKAKTKLTLKPNQT